MCLGLVSRTCDEVSSAMIGASQLGCFARAIVRPSLWLNLLLFVDIVWWFEEVNVGTG